MKHFFQSDKIVVPASVGAFSKTFSFKLNENFKFLTGFILFALVGSVTNGIITITDQDGILVNRVPLAFLLKSAIFNKKSALYPIASKAEGRTIYITISGDSCTETIIDCNFQLSEEGKDRECTRLSNYSHTFTIPAVNSSVRLASNYTDADKAETKAIAAIISGVDAQKLGISLRNDSRILLQRVNALLLSFDQSTDYDRIFLPFTMPAKGRKFDIEVTNLAGTPGDSVTLHFITILV